MQTLPSLRRVRAFAIIVELACSIGFLPEAHALASFVQVVASTTSGTASSSSLSFSKNTVAGDLIVVGFDFNSSAKPSSITDSQGNIFTLVGTELTTPGGAHGAVYYAKNIKGGADKVTVTLSASSAFLEIYLTEYSGVDQTNPIDAQVGASGSAGSVSSGNATTTVTSDVIYSYCVGDMACTVGSGFTARSTFDGNLIEDKTAGNAGTYAATGSATAGWTMQLVALKPAAAAPVITSSTIASGTVGSAFSYQITATNSPTSYGATGLPAGLTVNTATGLISGTPTAAGTSTVTLSATNSGGTGTATLTLTIALVVPAPVITSASTANGTVGSAFSYQITATNSPTSYGAAGLPAGLTVNSATGLISGTPTAAGASTVTLSASNSGGTGNATLTLAVAAPPAPVITSSTTASGTVGSAFSYQITATNSPTSYGAAGLPAGLTVNSATGLISGTPTAAGTSTVTLSASNSGGTGNATLTLAVAAPPAPVITSSTTASGTVGSAFSYQITATNSPTSYGAAGLPAGLTVNSATGLISGTPTAAGTSTVTLSATNSGGTGNATLTLAVAAPPAPVITSSTTASGTVGGAFSYQIAATNSPTSYAAAGLPAGLTVNTATGLISGTPTAAGTSTVTLSATNSAGTGNATLTLTIASAAPVITSSTTASGTVGGAFSYQITATNSPTSYGAAGLPAGLTVNTATGLISGTPTAAGTSTVTLSATNSAGTGNATLTLTIASAAPVITSSTTASGTVGGAFSYQITATNSPTSYGAVGLPAGLTVNSRTGLISGTPTAVNTSTVTLSATNSKGTGNATLTLTVASAAPAITSATTANGTVGSAFSYQITATNSPTSYAAAGLPAGLRVNSRTGLVSGTPSAAGTSTVTLSATNSEGHGGRNANPHHRYPGAGDHQRHNGQRNSKAAPSPIRSRRRIRPPVTAAAGLPAGLTVNSATGLISGTPTAAGTSTVTLSATNSGGTGSATLTLTIAAAAPVITSATTASGTQGSAFSYQITATNSPTSYAAAGLPAGLTVNTATGLISGTPTAAGTSTVTLSATNSAGTGNATLTLTVAAAPPVITSATTASGAVGSAFSYQIMATNSPTSYAATGLPAGLTVNNATGLISGTPTAAGTSTVTLSATNSGGTGTATLTLTIALVVPAPVITSATTASGTVGSAFSYQITATNSPISYGAAGLPAGLTVNTATGLISGTPTAAGTSTVTLSATNSGGTGNATLTLTVAVPPAPVITSATTANGTVGSAFSYQITATNSPTSYGATGLPAGLTVNTATGLISGTPTAAGTSTVTVSATNSGGTGNATLTLTVAAPPAPVITSATTASGAVGSAFSYQIAATNSPTSYAAAGLPAGLTVDTGAGLISGTPTATGTSTVTLSATNSGGTGNATLTLTIAAAVPVVISSVTPNSGSTAGGTAVTITGTGFGAGATVAFAGAAATDVVVTDDTTISAGDAIVGRGSGNGDGDQPRWRERGFGQRVYLCRGPAAAEQRQCEVLCRSERYSVAADGGFSSGHDLHHRPQRHGDIHERPARPRIQCDQC